MPAHCGVFTIELRFPEAQTLKDKRQVLHSLLDRLAARFNLSVAETDGNDLHQRAAIALACVANSPEHCREVLDKALALVESEPRAMVLSVEKEVG